MLRILDDLSGDDVICCHAAGDEAATACNGRLIGVTFLYGSWPVSLLLYLLGSLLLELSS